MSNSIEEIKKEVEAFVVSSETELEAFRMRFISRKSVIGELFGDMKSVPAEERKAYGQNVNALRTLLKNAFNSILII